MKVECAWCGKPLGESGEEEGVSHGICPECLRKHFPHIAEKVEGMLEAREQNERPG